MEALKRLDELGLSGAEVVGTKAGKSVVRVYTEERGWTYEKVDPEDVQAIEAFAGKIMAPIASRSLRRVGK